ncbi:MAG: YcfL family protein [Phycisphaerales bacterium]|nr:YcfL family protein [Phycisphaerales bacterium]
MFKKVLTGCASAVMLVAVTGCTDPIAAQQDTYSPYPQVSVSTYSLKYDIAVSTPVVSHVGAGQLRVDIPVRNCTNKDIHFDYKFYFVDTNGVQVEGDKSWLSKRIPQRGMETIEFTSLTSSAADFRVQMRRKKFE